MALDILLIPRRRNWVCPRCSRNVISASRSASSRFDRLFVTLIGRSVRSLAHYVWLSASYGALHLIIIKIIASVRAVGLVGTGVGSRSPTGMLRRVRYITSCSSPTFLAM